MEPEDELELLVEPEDELELLEPPSIGVIPALLQPCASRAESTSRGVAKFFIASSHYW